MAGPAGDTQVAGATDAPADVPVVLQSDGLGFVVGGDAITQLAFESDEQTVLTALETALGPPSGDEDAPECGAGPLRAVSWDGFIAYFGDTGFGGWYLREPQPLVLTTANGVGLGTTLDELQAAFTDVTVAESSIGVEWSGGGFSGTLTDDTPAGTVDVMWSGANCIAR